MERKIKYHLQIEMSSIASENLIDKLAKTSLSIVFSGTPGVGKTTTELAWLAKVFQFYPDALVYVVGQKYDRWCGLWRIPGACTVLDGLNFQPLVERVDLVYQILFQRKLAPPEERACFKNSPVWLILADWSVTYNTLSALKKYQDICNDVRTKLGNIITLGREFHCGIVADVHSFNCSSLGLAKDTQLRDCLNLNILGKISQDESGMEQGSFQPLHKAITNRFLVVERSLRISLQQQLIEYQQLSLEKDRPILFSTMGHPPRMVLLPDLRCWRNYELPPEIISRLRERITHKQEIEEYLAQNSTTEVSFTTPIPQLLPLSPLPPLTSRVPSIEELPSHLQALVEFSRSHPDWLSARHLRNTAPFKRQKTSPGWQASQIREAFRELESLGWGSCQGEGDGLQWKL